MRYTIAALALAAGAQATYNMTGPVYTTEVVTAYTTYCPEATQITHNGETYTVTEATTLTITNCPCTVTKPVTSALVTSCYNCAPETSVPVASVPVVYSSPTPVVSTAESVPTTSAGVPYPVSNSTAVYVPSGTGSATTSSIPTFTGAANKAFAASGAGLAAVFGLAAYIL